MRNGSVEAEAISAAKNETHLPFSSSSPLGGLRIGQSVALTLRHCGVYGRSSRKTVRRQDKHVDFFSAVQENWAKTGHPRCRNRVLSCNRSNKWDGEAHTPPMVPLKQPGTVASHSCCPYLPQGQWHWDEGGGAC